MFTFLSLLMIGIGSTIAIVAFDECQKGNSNSLTRFLSPLSIFVWADGLVFGPFWAGVGFLGLVSHSWILVGLTSSLFFLVRSAGETTYWFLEQFSEKVRNKPQELLGYRLVKNESIWFVYQIMWQVATVFWGVVFLSFLKLWF